jgi:hypothetical protein
MDLDIDKLINSPIKIKICSFFHKNPSAIDTARNIALWINQDFEMVKKELEELADSEVLLTHRTPSTTAYSYTQDRAINSEIKKILKKGGTKC